MLGGQGQITQYICATIDVKLQYPNKYYSTMTKMKANKKKNDDSKNQHSWPNLPQQLISLIPRQQKLMQNITSFGGVTKTWRPIPKQCSPHGKSKWPQLVEIDTKSCNNHKNMRRHTFEIEFHQEYPTPLYKRRSYTDCAKGYFKGYSNGVLFGFSSNLPADCCLWRPECVWYPSAGCSNLPFWDLNTHPYKFAAVLPPDGNRINSCYMVLTGQSSHTFAFCEWSSSCRKWNWNFRDYAVKDPYNPGRNMEFCHGIAFKGKFYMLSLQGSLVVLEDTGSGFEVTGVSKGRAVPCNRSRQYREFFVELNGEILLVLLVSRKLMNVVDDVEIFRLDIQGLLWLKVESLGDGAMFLEEECCMGIMAEKIGCRKNCIYFRHSRKLNENLWFVYDMKIGQIFPASGNTNAYMKWDEPIDLEDPPVPRRRKWDHPGKW